MKHIRKQSRKALDPAYEAEDSCYCQNGWMQYPFTPVGAAVTSDCNRHINCNRDSDRHVGLNAKRCSSGVDIFGVDSLIEDKGSNHSLSSFYFRNYIVPSTF
ncbi:hypothetical protein TNCT_393301 [Trichonephila clavata]|uniref:Uncharacterized protein n=1 Tax=Trichonephila clavata TaxID=2740835 RepID=A0A8X6HQ71_TRICU|nr:hypothetical protein TNCT_393301 [Trichonephila clavata]